MLFTDGNPTRVEDLRVFESNIYEVANVEGIDLDAKLTVAAEEIGDLIMAYLLQPGSGDPQASRRRQLGLSTLVVTPSMRRWHALHTLSLTFRDAYHNQNNERYRDNWRQYVSASAEARAVLFRIGLGFVSNPLARPKSPEVISGPGAWPAGQYNIVVAWVNQIGQVSTPSDPVTVELTAGGAPTVTMTGVADGAVGWHVYAGEAGDDVFQQNMFTLPIGMSWTALTGSVLRGEMPGSGQFADIYIAASRMTPRG
jgi:hypothetical protein